MRGPIALAVLLFAAVRADGQDATAVTFFEKQVRPLLAEHCHSCHSAKANKARGGLTLDSRDALLKGGESGPAVVPGQPEKSLLVTAVHGTRAELQMPPKGRLRPAQVAVFEKWVKDGAVYPGGTVAAAPPSPQSAEARQFWSFLPLRRHPAPAVKDVAWTRRPIDSFLLAAMEARGLAPSAAADRRTLIRRASFDLTGLPPTPEEVAAFETDTAPDAYDRLIERLLASPHYGERWARYWLDLARYADVPESWVTGRGQAWPYRDWVVRALNADLPYDRFVQLQLAADLAPGATPADLAALGFLGMSPDYWKELQLDVEVIKSIVADEWEERIDAVSSTFLGLTVACARCHDHKFDPISTREYYALAGVIAGTRQVTLPLLPPAEGAAVRRAEAGVQALDEMGKAIKAKRPAPADLKAQLDVLASEAKRLEETPGYKVVPVRGVADGHISVVSRGPNATRLEFEDGVGRDIAMHTRGNPSRPGAVEPRRFLSVLSAGEPKRFSQGSGRLELARAITTDGAPLAARVVVNRVWKLHFGRGLVETPSDFGRQGERPSHPELLDDLAARFVAAGWSLKWLHREIVLSAAYRQGGATDAAKMTIDPDNRLLWRMSRRRLDVEAWRDAMLTVNGTLRRDLGGAPLELTDASNRRRTLYGLVRRRDLTDLLRLHDFPDPLTHTAARIPTTTALQQLYALNGPLLRQEAAALARRLAADEPAGGAARVRRAYSLLFHRAPTEREAALALGFLGSTPDADAWARYAHVLLGSNEFLFVD
ncbi:PSD1 and planctomycete cytochrome C domain-containing protein [Urbifossiella limnaea]|uniref:Planctomycete cytochrome C n=1 Tax=Urbifossiella limnaea TaxID=2528023 RepID=A0A517XNY3_9BACT|nr:PSD1 and planctomycete cytochrome C domain-containing protein [Urbifossiella limnaea]QDU19221.1 Planctomycete cytochrome C [Urbifossiella limnaea]